MLLPPLRVRKSDNFRNKRTTTIEREIEERNKESVTKIKQKRLGAITLQRSIEKSINDWMAP